jgi:hypothetical protein
MDKISIHLAGRHQVMDNWLSESNVEVDTEDVHKSGGTRVVDNTVACDQMPVKLHGTATDCSLGTNGMSCGHIGIMENQSAPVMSN